MNFSVIKRGIKLVSFAAILMYLITSCSTRKKAIVKQYPPLIPFVFDNKIIIEDTLPKDKKKKLLAELQNYWDDSLQVKETTSFLFFNKIKKPAVLDTNNITRTKRFMTAYLHAQGYYYSTVALNDIRIDTVKPDQLRATVTMKINLGKNITIDSLSYALTDDDHKTIKDSLLQQLALQQINNTYLRKGEEYTKQKISDELDRLVAWFRQNGYYKYTREYLYAYIDTTNENLFKLTLDPIQLANLIAEAEKKRKEKPEWDITIKQRIIKDSTVLNKFYINNIYYYPETKITDTPDSLIYKSWHHVLHNRKGDLSLRDYNGKFKLRPLREHTFLRKDSLYNENLYFKTLNTLSRIPAWQQVDARIIEKKNDSLDLHFFLIPQNKYQTSYNLEGSRNTGDFTAGNLLGISLSATLNDRNVLKQAIQSATTLRAGVELNFIKSADPTLSNSALIQTSQFSLTHTYSIPSLIMLNTFKRNKWIRGFENNRTLISGALAYTERYEIFKLRSANISLAYEGQRKNGNVFLWKPINLELYSIDTLPGLLQLFDANPFLRNSFNTGNVVGLGLGGLNFTKTSIGNNTDNTHFLRLGVEESGTAAALIPKLERQIFRFVKLEAEYKFLHKEPKTELAYRFFAGIGIPFGGQTLPFFKQYTAGGPYSMRAWGLRQLGLGSSILSDTIPANEFRDRFGDMQLEANIEFRFKLAQFGPLKIGSALFFDVGNIWNLKRDVNNANANFVLANLYKDLAIGMGTGLRFDFGYFVIRVDGAYKVKDPGRQTNNGWMSIKDFVWTEYRNNANQTRIRNYAIQLGIGLPF
jgi:hypothetical protein